LQSADSMLTNFAGILQPKCNNTKLTEGKWKTKKGQHRMDILKHLVTTEYRFNVDDSGASQHRFNRPAISARDWCN
jgi:hypothetical protein